MTAAEIAPYILALVALLTAVNGLRQTASKSDHKLIEEQGKLISAQGQRIDMLEKKLSEKEDRLDSLEKQNIEKDFHIQRMSEHLNERDEKIVKLEVWAKELVSERDHQISTLQGELDKANGRIKHLEGEVLRLQQGARKK